jgi:enolase-phosphatase E1
MRLWQGQLMIKAIVTDIEGTTSSISFVHKVLFPYAQQHLNDFVCQQYPQNPEVVEQVMLVAATNNLPEDDLDAVCAQLQKWISTDTKATPLKTLQGMIWRAGYQQGKFKGHVYPDVADALRQWHANDVGLYVYSSGSTEAQRLLFGYSLAGDLTPLFSDFFDTRIGSKTEVASYIDIADKIGHPAQQILFLSDVPAELYAAHEAGMQVVQLVRDASTQQQDQFLRVSKFADIRIEDY